MKFRVLVRTLRECKFEVGILIAIAVVVIVVIVLLNAILSEGDIAEFSKSLWLVNLRDANLLQIAIVAWVVRVLS